LKKLIIVLTGGLGNQLFQIQFAKYIQSKTNCKLYFDISLGKPRGENGVPDSFYFGIPGEVLTQKKSNLASKTMGYILRSSYAPTKVEQKHVYQESAKLLASLVLSIYFRSLVLALSPRNLGYDLNFKPSARNVVTMGYFQSYMYDTRKIFEEKCFSLDPHSDMINFYRNLAESDKPIVMHVRRGDYSSEDNFGLLGPKYYEVAINEILTRTNSSKIWLFSDDPTTALSLVPKNLHDRVRMIQEIDNLPANTLEVMRLGTGYVIANSSFSWWAAFSSYQSDAPVAAPAVWFKSMRSPSHLCPESWIKIESDFH
jgi:hypothetical protein